jgi:DNA polymerase-3 subunit alpha
MRWAAQRDEERSGPQMGLFAAVAGVDDRAPPLANGPTWPPEQELRAERETIGFFITGHPLDRYLHELRRFTNASTATLRARGAELPPPTAGERRHGGRPDARPRVRLGGVVQALKFRNSKKRGERYATFTLEDKEGIVEVVVWPDAFRRHEAVLQTNDPIVVSGALEVSEERCQVIADEITPLAAARAEAIRQFHVRVPPEVDRQELETLREILEAHPGPCEAFLHLLRGDDTEAVLALPSSLRVAPTDAVVVAVERVLGNGVTSFR